MSLKGKLADAAIGAFIDSNSVTCDWCGHKMIDVTAALDISEHQHVVAGDSEGEGSACAYCMLSDKLSANRVERD